MGIERIDRAYAERNALAVAFCKMALAAGWPAGKGFDTSMDGGWGWLVYVDTPSGQVSWHMHPDQAHLVQALPDYAGQWNGTYTARNVNWPLELLP